MAVMAEAVRAEAREAAVRMSLLAVVMVLVTAAARVAELMVAAMAVLVTAAARVAELMVAAIAVELMVAAMAVELMAEEAGDGGGEGKEATEESRAVARAAARMEVARVAFARAATMTAEAVAEVLPLADEPMSAT
jgi:hypothetical protein